MSSRKLQQDLIKAYVKDQSLGQLFRDDETRDIELKNAVIRGLKRTLAMLGANITIEECRQDRGCILAACSPVMEDGCFPGSEMLNKVGKMLGVDTDARGQFRAGVDRAIAAATSYACDKDGFSVGDVVICRGGHRGTLETMAIGNVQILLEDGVKITFKNKRAARLRHPPPKLRPPPRKTRSDKTPAQA